MRAQRILGVTVASIALAMTGMVGATTAQASDHHRCRHHHHHHHHHRHHHHYYRDCWLRGRGWVHCGQYRYGGEGSYGGR